MNVHHLELFYFVAKFEGITPAVKKMPYGIQQPAVSGQILQLEKSLGVKLFNRRPFALTKAGEELYDYIYPFFSKMNLVEARLKGEERNTLRLAASATILKNHLPIVLGVMKQKNPDLKLTLKHVEPDQVEALILQEEVDLAVSIVDSKPSGSLKLYELIQIPIILLLPENAKENSFAELLVDDEYERGKVIKYPLVGIGENKVLGRLFGEYMAAREIAWEASVQVDSTEVIYEYVGKGFGVGVSGIVPGLKIPKGLKVIRLDNELSVTLGVIYQGKLKPLCQQFVEHISEAANTLEEYI